MYYRITEKTHRHFECQKLDEDYNPVGESYAIVRKGDSSTWLCTCPAGIHRRSCKHTGFVHDWKKLPEPMKGKLLNAAHSPPRWEEAMKLEEDLVEFAQGVFARHGR